MKKLVILSVLAFVACKRNTTVYPPVGGVLSQSDLKTSKERTKNLNTLERQQIQDWISGQQTKFYPTKLNYWVDVAGFDDRQKQMDDAPVSYSYELYDFDMTKIYEKSFARENAKFGHFDELKAVENALRYMKAGEEITLLVPSSLAYGTFGDENKIDNDVPLIIKLKLI
ncbi:FKBP-type peptidyl-prolyl cis-trans isomerase [Chryseobacterium caseinilyticum]|uniref:Peptidyl-prolyl cis-trans isomerase n=1 Tax=Chryseobacterium caseinilyticum TaxID=2771428 RepID=A0ABR8Z952_9FLAO|nr:FKBP-type peptidyl-prolyl cis-trans isomerase [Chryseobacterium caseinilyticum]MBD8081756.1 FKBP-type peptidyl-prolyl cis-trans isomerase [Chryseobacterium caseinilyticum]